MDNIILNGLTDLMQNETANKIRNVLFREVSLAFAIASFVFFALNYINSPVNKINQEIAAMQVSLQDVAVAHEAYGKVSSDEADQIKEININMAKIEQALVDKGIISK